MSSSDGSIERRLRALVGPDGQMTTDDDGTPNVAPSTATGCALVLRTASAEGWRVRIVGNGSWIPPDAPAELTLSSRGLGQVEDVHAADLVATVQSGVDQHALREALADRGTWWPVDAPGDRRSVGSLVATATAGPLRSGFGNIRDHLLGLTIVTADGHILNYGGRVAKNVAGFDLTKLATGSFGAFGFISSVHLRLRPIPRADATLTTNDRRDALLGQGQAILDAGITPSALELLSPVAGSTGDWTLGVRLIGSDATVEAERAAVAAACTARWTSLSSRNAADFWRDVQQRATQHATTIRVGCVITELRQAINLVLHHLDDATITASIGAGVVRWSGSASAARLQLLRRTAAQVEMPVTIERAPWPLRNELGHFGLCRKGVNRLMGSLRHTFDPQSTLTVALAGRQ